MIVTLMPEAGQQLSVAVGGANDHAVPHCTVWFEPQVMTGGVVSTTVTIWLQVAALVQQSVARQVRVMIVVQGGMTLVIVVSTVMVTFVPQQRSKAVGGSNDQMASHWTVLLLAQVITGGVVSITWTTSVQVEVFVQQSVACQVLVTK